MLERILIVLTVISILFMLVNYIRRRQLHNAHETAAKLFPQTENQLLYFSSTLCTQCSGQERILEEVFKGDKFQDITLKKYAIESDAKLAEQWRVKTLPTTILLSADGEIKQFNNGLISTAALLSQLNERLIEK